MKKLQIFILCMFTQHAFGQDKLTKLEEKVTSDGISYKISQRSSYPNSRKLYSNASNKLDNDLAIIPVNVSRVAFSTIDMGKDESKRRDGLIKKSFELKSRPIPDDTLFVNYKITRQGKILELSFLIKSNSKISVDDLSLIEKTLKNDYVIKLDSKQFKEMKYIGYSAPLALPGVKNL
ncbi:hypothetical protein DYBT9275_02823 [Dyadobacter sp. CECT 9275]|uniref:Uncharacterized protein n=1 Tax=Dyadobacter helix TaxID=2822344 RepID=A0A916JC27_9BACT|nr:hypothetical protein [Dyadobacter sp. CECT 9275]CAG5002160.1 hypothetical protein DYBT9275_02823 [Dyadobacter sp. CECT 9275]